jgi:hypothetical protein
MRPLVIASVLDELQPRGRDRAVGGAAETLAHAAIACSRGDASGGTGLLEGAVSRMASLADATHFAGVDLLDRGAREHRVVAACEMRQLADDVLVYDAYFGLLRVARASAIEQAIAAVPVLCDLARNLPPLLMTLDAKAALASFAARLLFAGEAGGTALSGTSPAGEAWGSQLDVCARWKLGHLVYGLANRAAAQRIERALAALDEGQEQAACELLTDATRDLEAASAAMEFATAITASEYCRLVRPTMHPPALEVALSGGLNADHRALRQAISRLHAVLDQSFTDLAHRCPDLAHARDGLLHADLSDLERHIVLTLRLVGSRPALDEPGDESAVQSLRALYLRRARRYSAMLRKGQAEENGGGDGTTAEQQT